MTTRVIVYIYTPRGGSRLAHALSGTDAKKRYSIYYRDLNTTRLDAALSGAIRAYDVRMNASNVLVFHYFRESPWIWIAEFNLAGVKPTDS